MAADDRTGALETAAALADRLGQPVPVAVWPDAVPPRQSVAVIDLASRHLTEQQAIERAVSLPTTGRLAHKIDSTLRGNWAAELVARHRSADRPLLVVPALPALGRTCVGGEVREHGLPVHLASAGSDARHRVASSRPADHLLEAGAGAGVVALSGLHAAERWLAAPFGIAVADAIEDRHVEQLVEAWRCAPLPILAGTSAVIAATVPPPHRRSAIPTWTAPALVVCGSANPVARRQLDKLTGRGVTVLSTPVPEGPVSERAARQAARALAEQAAARWNDEPFGVVVAIGGDTAAALLGEALTVVHGSAGPGTAVVETIVVDVPVITRAGGFGGDDALVHLLAGTLPW